jgi:AcrR family transcriptional regulator
VLAAALHAFAVHGYQGVSVRTLSRELGVSHNLLHQRFGSKEEIWYAAVDWAFGNLVAELTKAETEQGDPMTRLRRFIRTFVEYSARHPDLARVANAEGSAEDETAAQRLKYLLRGYTGPTMARIVPLYLELMAAGQLREVPPETFYYLITSTGLMHSNRAMTTMLFSEAALAEERVPAYADSVVSVILDGLIPRPDGGEPRDGTEQGRRPRP